MAVVNDLVPSIKADYPMVHICAVVISEHHLKMLRLERYMQGDPLEEVKQSGPQHVCGIPVIIALENGQARCPGCGGLHELDVVWYHKR
ncbi:MAG TPA: hypothetical protein VNG51_19350 [Ktedonobacteraceae bacterium]|nr:hypothetical protein [Ktedonobacteraceae bacterium]